MKKIILFLVFLVSIASLNAGGGDAIAGGFLGGMMGGVVSSAMTKSNSRDSGGRAIYAVQQLGNAVDAKLEKIELLIKRNSDEIEELKDENKELRREISNLKDKLYRLKQD